MNQYLEQAAHCRQMAADAIDEVGRQFWLRMEQFWLRKAGIAPEQTSAEVVAV